MPPESPMRRFVAGDTAGLLHDNLLPSADSTKRQCVQAAWS